MAPKTATTTKINFKDSAVIDRLEELRKLLVKVKKDEAGGKVSFATFRGYEKQVPFLKQLFATVRPKDAAVPANIRCLVGLAAELADFVGRIRELDQPWLLSETLREALMEVDDDFDLDNEITLPEDSDDETSGAASPTPGTPDSFHFIRPSTAKAMSSSKDASSAEKDRPKPKQKAKPTASAVEEYSPVRQTSKQALPATQKPRGVKRQLEVEIKTTPESTSGNNSSKNKKSDAARPAKKAKTSTTTTKPKKGILKKTSTVAEPRTRRQHSRARSAAPSDAEQEEEDEEESCTPARTIKINKGKNRARTPAVSDAGDVEEEEEESTKPRRRSTRKDKERERSSDHDSDDEGPVFGPFVLPTIRETSTEPAVLIDHYRPSRYTVSYRQQKSNKTVHALSQGSGDLRVIAPLATRRPISVDIETFLSSNASTAFAFEPCMRCMERNLRCNPVAPTKGSKGQWIMRKCGHCTTAGQVCSQTLDLGSLADMKNLMSLFSRDSDLALRSEIEALGNLYNIQNTTRQQINLAAKTLANINDDIEFRKRRLHESVQNPMALLHLLGQSNNKPLSKKQVNLLLAATGWHKDDEFHTGTELVFDSDDQEWKVKDLLHPTGSGREPSPMNVDDNDFELGGGILSPLPPPTSKASTSKASSSKTSVTQSQEDDSMTDSGDENGAGPSARRKSRSAGTTPKRVEFKGSANTPQAILRLLSRLRQGLRTTVFAPWVSYYFLLGVILALRLPPTGMSTPPKAYAEALFKGISSKEPTHWQVCLLLILFLPVDDCFYDDPLTVSQS
ncbi:hypothetical protein K435DRAFT_878549 [Dendrothele bispora CBS 962.96]|uniref:Uncharacterized protein n=1 Tax=Dendrothele bispora (strain CBS 962.96) TaxID=1314807 RepID=A0A4S8KN50_DENBC|nr:hypothetical protein K435DRAFT_878549 [Dendrothele bispora CBS 962.96]